MSFMGLMATGLAIVGLYDPEGVDKIIFVICIIFAVGSFLASWLIWKSSR